MDAVQSISGISGHGQSCFAERETLRYVVNSPPEFDSSYGGNGINVFQVATSTDANWSRVNLGYRVQDPDTDGAGAARPYYVAMTFEYSTSSGATWATIPSGHLTTSIATSTVATSTYSTYTTFGTHLPLWRIFILPLRKSG